MAYIHSPKMVVVSRNPLFYLSSSNIIYSDISPDPTKLSMVVNADAILVSITNLLTTCKGERLNLPEYGADLPDFLFELMTEDTEWELKMRIFNEITAWEPRVRMDMAQSYTVRNEDNHCYNMHLVFHLVGMEGLLLEYSGILTRTKSILGSIFQSG